MAPKLPGGRFRAAGLARAIQGNFDHLMGIVKNLGEAHNLVVDDLEELGEGHSVSTQQIAEHTHEGTDTTPVSHNDLTNVTANQHHAETHHVLSAAHSDSDSADTPAVGDSLVWDGSKWTADVADSEASGHSARRGSRPPAIYEADHEHEGWIAPPGVRGADGAAGATGAAGTPGSAGAPGVPWLGEDGAEDFGMWVPPVPSTATGSLTDHTHSAPGDGGADLFPSGMTEIDGTFVLEHFTSDALAVSTNDYHATSMETGIGVELTLAANINLTGLDFSGLGGPFVNGQVFAIRLSAGDTHTLTLKHESVSSSAANRFFLPGAADLAMTAGNVVFLIYHGGASRWNLWGVEGPPGPTGATGATGATGPAGSAGTGGGGMPAVYDEPDNDLWGMPVPPRDTQKHVINWTSKLRVAAGDTSQRIYLPFSGNVREVYFTLPGSTSTTVRVDVKKNGTSIFGTKPSTSSGFISSFAVPSAPTFTRGDYLTVRMDAVGNAGGRILVYIEVTEA